MIKEFNDVYPRDSAIIYASELEQIKKLFAEDPVLAGELAISAMELALTGQISSDNLIVQLSLEPMFKIGKQAKESYDRRKEIAQDKKIRQYRLDEIADMLNQGYNQSQIARALGTSRQTISNRIKIIQKDFPQLIGGQGCQSSRNSFDNQMKMLDKMSSNFNQNLYTQVEMLDKEIGDDETQCDDSSENFLDKMSSKSNKVSRKQVEMLDKMSNLSKKMLDKPLDKMSNSCQAFSLTSGQMLDKMSSKNNQVSSETSEMLDKNAEMLDILSSVSSDVKRVKHNVNVNVNVNNDNLTQPDFITVEELDAMGCNYELRGSQVYIVDTGKVFNLKF